MDESFMRAFLGFSCGDELSNSLQSTRRPLDDISAINPVNAENFHLTVKFLGEMSTETLNELDRSFQRTLPTVGPLDLKVDGLGVFPNLDQPSVIWAGVEMTDQLELLVKEVESNSVELGADQDDRDFHAHITLARIKDSLANKEELIDWMRNNESNKFGQLYTDELVLFESELTPDGPIYHRRNFWPL